MNAVCLVKTTATHKQHVLTQMVVIHAPATLDGQEMESHVQTLMNVLSEFTIVMIMPPALISKVITLASAKLDTLAMEHHVKVNILIYLYYSSSHYLFNKSNPFLILTLIIV